MGGTSSFISLLRLTGFLGAAWLGSKASRLIGISSIVLEIAIGILLGPNVLDFVPTDYSVCRAKQISCEAPPDLLAQLRDNDVIDGGLGTVYNMGLCPKEHYSFQFGHDGEIVNGTTSNASSAALGAEEDGAAAGGHRRLSAAVSYPTIEACLVKSCTSMVSRQCLLSPAFLSIVGQAGVALMIFESGMHFDFGRAPRVAPKSFVVAVLGAGLPLIAGAGLTTAFGKPFIPDGLAVGTALAPTSIGIALRLLTEAGALQEDFGQATICAAFLDDIISLVLLNVLFSLHGEFDAMKTVGKPIIGIAFMALAMVAAVKVWPTVINDWILARVPETNSKVKRKDEVLFFIMICFLVAYATITYFLGTHLWGCFTAGMSFTCLFKNHHAHHVWVRQTKRVTTWMIRIFFSAAVAFSIPISKLLSIDAFWKGTLMGLGPCILAKFLCAPHMGDAKFVIGAAMVGRAEFAYLVAQMAVSADMMDTETYSIVIWSLLYATIFAPLLFRKLLNRYMATYGVAERDVEGGGDAVAAGLGDAGELKAVEEATPEGGSATCEAKDTAEADVVDGVAATSGKAVEDDDDGGCGHCLLGSRGPCLAREVSKGVADAAAATGRCSAPHDVNDVADAGVGGVAVARKDDAEAVLGEAAI